MQGLLPRLTRSMRRLRSRRRDGGAEMNWFLLFTSAADLFGVSRVMLVRGISRLARAAPAGFNDRRDLIEGLLADGDPLSMMSREDDGTATVQGMRCWRRSEPLRKRRASHSHLHNVIWSGLSYDKKAFDVRRNRIVCTGGGPRSGVLAAPGVEGRTQPRPNKLGPEVKQSADVPA